MRLPFPGPTAVLGGAAAAADAIETALGLVPRAAEAMERLEALLDRAEALATRADQVVTRADEATRRTYAILDTAEIVTRDASRTVDGAGGVLDRVDRMVTTWEKPLRKLAPAAQRFADGLDETEVTAAITLVDRMPTLLDHVESDVLPMLQKLDRVGPDLHEVLEVVQDLRRVVTGLPGIGLLRKRGEEEPPQVDGSLHD